ncbi:MAG: AMP-binding protein, partial [Thiomicrorhabdus sp.]|nr:AMP-binding protein [Thiomicrorhabdus sp.]
MKGLFKFIVKGLFKLVYRVEVSGIEHYQNAIKSERPLLIIANHVSLLDGPLLDLFVPGETTFMVDTSHTKKWHERFILSMSHYFKVDIHSPYAAKHMIDELKKGRQCMIFPEGRITTTGSLMKVYEGTGLIADKTKAAVLPIHISGAVRSRFSYLDGTRFAFIKRMWFPKIQLHIQPLATIAAEKSWKSHEKHKHYKQIVFNLLRDASFNASVVERSLFASLVAAKQSYFAKEVCVEDINDQKLTLKKLNQASVILGKALQKNLKNQQRVGLMLPNVAGMPASFFALQAYGYVPAMINFTAGQAAIRSACETAELQTIITSKKFVEAFEIQGLIDSLSDTVKFLYLEDVRTQINLFAKLAGLVTSPKWLAGYATPADSEAVVLFTSGSEGMPKGVVLSHSNIVNNIEQINAMFNIYSEDKIFNA